MEKTEEEKLAIKALNALFLEVPEPVATDVKRIVMEAFDSLKKKPVASETDFQKELASLINRNSMENNSNTPDFILARYLENCLISFNDAVACRDKWYGINPKPGQS